MISTTPAFAPTDLLGLGGSDMRPAYGPSLCGGLAVRAVAPIAPTQGTGLPAVGTAVRRRSIAPQVIGHDVVTTNVFQNTGTTLGIHSSRRPQS